MQAGDCTLNNELTRWLTLNTRVMSEPVKCSPVAFLIGETKDNMGSVVDTGHEVLVTRKASQLMLPSRKSEGFGFSGVDWCINKFQKEDQISLDKILVMEHDDSVGNPNTATELICFTRWAKEVGVNDAILIASPFHQLRSFMTAATVAVREHTNLNFWSLPGKALEWHESAIHSQGTTSGDRIQLLEGEFRRIEIYQNPNNKPYPLLSVSEVLKYMDQRKR